VQRVSVWASSGMSVHHHVPRHRRTARDHWHAARSDQQPDIGTPTGAALRRQADPPATRRAARAPYPAARDRYPRDAAATTVRAAHRALPRDPIIDHRAATLTARTGGCLPLGRQPSPVSPRHTLMLSPTRRMILATMVETINQKIAAIP